MAQEDKIIKKGKWYLPNSLIQVEGILSFSNQEGATLETFGGLIPLHPQYGEKKIEVILGNTLEGEEITLYDCFRTSHTEFSITGKSSAKYYSNYVFIGKHFYTNEILLDNIEVQVPNLMNWLEISGFENFSNNWDEGIELKYKKPNDLNFIIDDNRKISFVFSQNYSWVGRFDFTIKQEATLVFTSATLIEFQEWLMQIYTFTYFLSFCYFRFAAPISFRTLLEKDNKLNPYTYILFKSILNPIELSEDFFKMLLNFKIVKSEFETIVANLYFKSISLEPILFILGTSYKRASIIPELYFLTMIQALETYHRRFIGGFLKSEEEWTQIKKEILEAVHEEHKTIVREALQYKNELSLRRRLKDLLNNISDSILTPMLITNKSDFIDTIVRLRNYFTHYDQHNIPSYEGEYLINLTYKIRLVLIFSLLCELGLDKETVTNIFINSGQTFFSK